ncbi:hypothetical protein FKM82_016864 [Ascaphus truei]
MSRFVIGNASPANYLNRNISLLEGGNVTLMSVCNSAKADTTELEKKDHWKGWRLYFKEKREFPAKKLEDWWHCPKGDTLVRPI